MADISDCVGSKHRATRAVADKCLNMILEIDRNADGELGELGAQVRKRRYLAHITRNGLKLFVLTAELTEFTVILQETAVMIQTSWGVTLKMNGIAVMTDEEEDLKIWMSLAVIVETSTKMVMKMIISSLGVVRKSRLTQVI